jgi:hypothetical protein
MNLVEAFAFSQLPESGAAFAQLQANPSTVSITRRSAFSDWNGPVLFRTLFFCVNTSFMNPFPSRYRSSQTRFDPWLNAAVPVRTAASG